MIDRSRHIPTSPPRHHTTHMSICPVRQTEMICMHLAFQE